MNKNLLYLFLVLVTVAFVGCSDGNDVVEPQEPAGTLTFRVNTAVETENGGVITYPEGSVGTQHVTDVYIMMFIGEGDGAVYDGFAENVGWSEYFLNQNGTLPDHLEEMKYRTDYCFEGTVTILGIGMSKGVAAKFNIPASVAEGTTLREVATSLQDLSDSRSILSSEIFTGTVLYRKGSSNVLEMKRRMAGIMATFGNIPTTINDKRVDEIRLVLYANKNTSVPVIARQQKPYFHDYIESPSTDPEGNVILRIPVMPDFGLTTKVEGGGYLLPMPAPSGHKKYTMRVELVNLEGGVCTVLKTIRVKFKAGDKLDHGQTGGGTGIIDTESTYRFPIIANHFYAIGRPAMPIDLNGNGAEIVIELDPTWDGNDDLEVIE